MSNDMMNEQYRDTIIARDKKQLRDIINKKGSCPVNLYYCTSCVIHDECWDLNTTEEEKKKDKYNIAVSKSVAEGYIKQEEAFDILL